MKDERRRPGTIIRDNHVHDLYDKIMCDLGELRNVVANAISNVFTAKWHKAHYFDNAPLFF